MTGLDYCRKWMDLESLNSQKEFEEFKTSMDCLSQGNHMAIDRPWQTIWTRSRSNSTPQKRQDPSMTMCIYLKRTRKYFCNTQSSVLRDTVYEIPPMAAVSYGRLFCRGPNYCRKWRELGPWDSLMELKELIKRYMNRLSQGNYRARRYLESRV